MSSIRAFPTDETRLRDFLPAGIIAIATAAGLLLATASVEPTKTTVAIIFAPWLGADEVLSRVWQADGRVVRFGNFENIIVADFPGKHALNTARDLGGLIIDPIWTLGCGLAAK